MRNSDLEKLYSRINDHIKLIGSYLQDDILIKIIKSCRLKPYSIFTGDFKPDVKFEKHWVDEFGNSLKFENKSTQILLNDTEIMNHTKISTDLFFGNSIKDTVKNSKGIFISTGKYFDIDIHIVVAYGQDEYIRSFIYNKKWYRISPLLLGINTLHELFKNINNYRITEIDVERLDCVLKLDVQKCVAASLPLKQDIGSYFNSEITNIL